MIWRCFTVILAVMFILPGNATAQSRSPELLEKFQEAQQLRRSGKIQEALLLFVEIVEEDPSATGPRFIGATLALRVNDHDLAIRLFEELERMIAPDFFVFEGLVLAYTAEGEIEKAEIKRKALIEFWSNSVDSRVRARKVFRREQMTVAGQDVVVLERLDQGCPICVVYEALPIGANGRPEYKISMGSYETTNQFIQESGLDGQKPAGRIHHLDAYREGGLHETYGFFDGLLPYSDFRKMVTDVITGKLKPQSRSRLAHDEEPAVIQID